MAAKTYFPTLVVILQRLSIYLARYQDQMSSQLTSADQQILEDLITCVATALARFVLQLEQGV